MSTTKIEWCDTTINPIVGCSKCSPGCDNCYAERIAARMAKHPNPKISGKYAGVVDERGKWTGKVNVDLSCLRNLPKKPSRIFVGSMCDLFHENVHYGDLMNIMCALIATSRHTFILLTKRPDRMLRPRELYRANGFPDSYEIAPLYNGKPLNITSQVKKCGNSVPHQFVVAVFGANLDALEYQRTPCRDMALPLMRLASMPVVGLEAIS